MVVECIASVDRDALGSKGSRAAVAATSESPWWETRLSPREREVAHRCLEGRPAAEIGRTLHISLHTVRNHLKSIYKKLQVSSMPELVVLLSRAGALRVSCTSLASGE